MPVVRKLFYMDHYLSGWLQHNPLFQTSSCKQVHVGIPLYGEVTTGTLECLKPQYKHAILDITKGSKEEFRNKQKRCKRPQCDQADA